MDLVENGGFDAQMLFPVPYFQMPDPHDRPVKSTSAFDRKTGNLPKKVGFFVKNCKVFHRLLGK